MRKRNIWHIVILLGILSISAYAAAADSIVTLSLYPRVVFAGSGVRLTCRVPRDARNRTLAYGFDHWQQSTRQLDGLDARITWMAVYFEMPCDPGEGFCMVQRADGSISRITAPLIIAGCER